MLWHDILSEIKHRKTLGRKASLLSDDKEQEVAGTRREGLGRRRSLATYALGAKYEGIYFTKREAECMVWLLRGKTINRVAEILALSPRTVEYYLKNMKNKVGCRTKFELIDLVYASEFQKNVDFSWE